MREKIAIALLALSLDVALLAFLTGTGLLYGQDASKVVYDVSTVRLHDPADPGMSWGAENGILKASNVQLKNLIADAWGVRPDQVAGEPAWADNERWDVNGKVTDMKKDSLKRLTNKDVLRMEQALLVERFHARVHVETRTGTIFNLVPAKSGLKLTVLHPHEVDGKADQSPIPLGSIWMRGAEGGGYEMVGHGIGMKQLISNIAVNLQQTVIDKTGLPGDDLYEINLKFAPETGTNTSQNGDAVSLREALEQQLGLHLESGRGPVLTVVVDHIEKPAAN